VPDTLNNRDGLSWGLSGKESTFQCLFFSSVTFFIVDINLCLYIGLLQLYGVFLFFFFSLSLFLILVFNFSIYYFYTFIPLFAFPVILFPLQLIFNVYKSYIPLFNFAYLFFLSLLSSQHIC